MHCIELNCIIIPIKLVFYYFSVFYLRFGLHALVASVRQFQQVHAIHIGVEISYPLNHIISHLGKMENAEENIAISFTC